MWEQSSAEGGGVAGVAPLVPALRRGGSLGRRVARSPGLAAPRGRGVTAITGRVQRTGGQGIEAGAYFFAVPSFTGCAFGAGLVSVAGWGMWTDWTRGTACAGSDRPSQTVAGRGVGRVVCLTPRLTGVGLRVSAIGEPPPVG